MKQWSDLPIRERHAYIKTGVANGITTLEGVKKAYNSFATGSYMDNTGSNGSNDSNTYTMESYVNPLTTTCKVAKTAVQLLDPTGISSYPDVYDSGKRFFEEPTLRGG